ncbi:MAG: sulfate ABC transporter substrate-binding protein [Acetobacterium sp.]
MKKIGIIILVLTIGVGVIIGCAKNDTDSASSKSVEITNVSYDPTREFYEAYNAVFAKYWKDKTGQDLTVIQSHGGSGTQARSVIEGNEADVVTLALGSDVTAIQKAGLIDPGWKDELANNSAPYTSTIVFLVRKGNPKNILDWGDLTKAGVGVITPNPKTSGGARWNYLAAWAYADKLYSGDEAKTKEYIKALFGNVLVLDSGARGAATTFAENGQGDVLLAWENEAYLAMKESPDAFEIITPSISVLAEPSVAVVDEVVNDRGTQEVAKEYLSYLYTDEAQKIAGENYYRPSNQTILQEFSDVFDLNVKLVTIDDPIFGGWDKAQSTHFNDDGVFDEIYSK